MQSPVQIVNVKERLSILANLLLDTNHGAFPVVSNDDLLEQTYLGIITRYILIIKQNILNTKQFKQTRVDNFAYEN
jgi:hypothetical protein